VTARATEIAADDAALLDRLAGRVVALRLETPAIVALETARPLSVIAGQAMVFFEPIVLSLFRLPDYRRFARLIERRECLERLTGQIEVHVARREEAARAAKAARTR